MGKMTLRQAKAKLKKLAKGKYHSAELRLTGGLITPPTGEERRCLLYIEGTHGQDGPIGDKHTFEESFEQLISKMGG